MSNIALAALRLKQAHEALIRERSTITDGASELYDRVINGLIGIQDARNAITPLDYNDPPGTTFKLLEGPKKP